MAETRHEEDDGGANGPDAGAGEEGLGDADGDDLCVCVFGEGGWVGGWVGERHIRTAPGEDAVRELGKEVALLRVDHFLQHVLVVEVILLYGWVGGWVGDWCGRAGTVPSSFLPTDTHVPATT